MLHAVDMVHTTGKVLEHWQHSQLYVPWHSWLLYIPGFTAILHLTL